MPRISAPTVKEHHDIVFEKLINSAEEILRSPKEQAFTAGAIAKKAGIARNSIYRYVQSVDHLRLLVLERYLPIWKERATAATQAVDAPADKLIALVDVSLELGAQTGHQWLINVLKKTKFTPETFASMENLPPSVVNFHRELAHTVVELCQQIDPMRAAMNARIVRSLMDCGLRALDDGLPLEDVRQSVLHSVRSLLDA
ncbi:TetR/AcrR family transcriptional regulator [Arcanobacterium phocisimile]|uniref:TetR/AcrR family transcriptional regulator n=1 Tax=Arcanobacterium phocisimile TaxID=1302235 RepID=A0ABX7IK04_9ACTO|nr:TetR/AcrR family transcriptional regulator [Arcanobacterium phocisimile]QRV02153.1 TetR/AcrR family transcriptional regulator [Arcanobacterium phocisimile]